MILIGLSGRKGSGKDFAGAYLRDTFGFEILKFAAPLYASAAAVLDVPPSFLDAYKNIPEAKLRLTIPAPDGGRTGMAVKEEIVKEFTIREYLQRYGTEAHRDVFGESFWTDRLIQHIHAFPDGGGAKKYVVTDCRFDNEAEAIHAAGGVVVYLERGESDGDTHASERPPTLIDFRIDNNGPPEDLYEKLGALYTTLFHEAQQKEATA